MSNSPVHLAHEGERSRDSNFLCGEQQHSDSPSGLIVPVVRLDLYRSREVRQIAVQGLNANICESLLSSSRATLLDSPVVGSPAQENDFVGFARRRAPERVFDHSQPGTGLPIATVGPGIHQPCASIELMPTSMART